MSGTRFGALQAEQGVVRLVAEFSLLGASKRQIESMFSRAVEARELRRLHALLLPDADNTTRDLRLGGREPGGKFITRLAKPERRTLARLLNEVVVLVGRHDLHTHDAVRAVWRKQLGYYHRGKQARVDLSFAVLISGVELAMARRLRVVKCMSCGSIDLLLDGNESQCASCFNLLRGAEEVSYGDSLPGSWEEEQKAEMWKHYA